MDPIEENNVPEEQIDITETLVSGNNKKVKKKKRKAKVYTPFKCEICSKHFTDKYLLTSHMGTHAAPRAYACAECEFACKTRKYLARHVKNRHGGARRYECRHCGKKFTHRGKLESHTRVHTGEKPFECGRCGKRFSARYSLQTHMYIHTDEKPFKCAYCPYACRDSSTLRKHQQRHLGIKSVYQCKTCDQEYRNKYALKNHVAQMHLSLDINKHECGECGKMFSSKNSLSIHKRAVHDGSLKCKCELCGTIISNRHNLKMHMRTHVNARPFKCKHEGCDKAFKDPSSLRKHEILHTPSEFYPCEICGREFSRYMRLVKHIDVHVPKVKVECDYCGIKFLTKNYLAKHIRQKHARKRQKYICDMCDFVTHNKPSIVMHIKYGHVTGYSNECKECDKKFKRVKNLNLHYLKFHGLRFKTTVPTPNVEVKIEPLDEPPFELDIKQEIPDEITVQPEDILHDTERTDHEPEPSPQESQANQIISSHSKQLRKVPEEVFDEFYIKRVEGHERKIKHIPDPKLDEVAMNSLRKLVAETRQHDELLTLERTRQQYNERMRTLLNSAARKKDKVHIKHFDPNKSTVNTKSGHETDKESLNNSNHAVEELNDKEPENATVDGEKLSPEEFNKGKDVNVVKETSKRDDLNDKEPENTSSDDIIVSPKEINKSKVDDAQELSKSDDFDREPEKYTHDKTVLPEKINESKDEADGEISQSVDITNKEPENTMPDDKIDSPEETNESSPKTDDGNSINEKKGKHRVINEREKEKRKKNCKIKFNTHQCYICFKLYETKEKLLDHCKEHFDVCNNIALKKCPLCEYVTKLNIRRHLKLVHKVNIKIPYAQIKDKKDNTNGSRYYYEINNEKIKKLEVIPSVKNLNKMAMLKIDNKKRETKNMMIAKTKLVRKGKEWIVEHEDMDISKEVKDHMLPKVSEKDIIVREKKLKIGEVWSDKYVDRLKRLYKIMKKKGVKMLFPCEDCDKICQTAAALKLHVRRHDNNAKPFRKKVWKHKLIENRKVSRKNNKNCKKNKVNNKSKEEDVNPLVKQPKVPKKEDLLSHRLTKPKPIVNKHKCDPQLMEFYEKNIRGGNIEFWQFLKIFNKMDREKVNDFKDLEQRTDFGIHFSVEKEAGDEINNVPDTTSEVKTLNKIVKVTRETKQIGAITKQKNKDNIMKNCVYKRVSRLSKAEHRRRNALKDKLRAKFAEEKAISITNQCSVTSSQQAISDA